jgi:hypothetical protein
MRDTNGHPGRARRADGTRFIDYLPEYYLAIVLVNEGKNSEAIELFAKVQRDGLVTENQKEFAELRVFEKRARDAVAALQAAAASPAVPSQTRVEDQPRSDETNRRTRFESLMQEGQSGLRARQFASARASAMEARNLGVDNAKADDLVRSIDVSEALQAGRDAAGQKQWPDVRRAAARVYELSPGNAEARQLEDQASKGQAIDQLESAALKAFYTGDYATSIRLLERLVQDVPDSARGYFYLACNNAALGLRAGSGGSKLIAQARSHYARVLGHQKDFEVDRLYISPRILQALSGTASGTP